MLGLERKKQMRAIGHHLKPVILIGDNGMSTGLLDELDRALEDHELIKVKVHAERDTRKILIASLCEETVHIACNPQARWLYYSAQLKSQIPRLSNLIRPI